MEEKRKKAIAEKLETGKLARADVVNEKKRPETEQAKAAPQKPAPAKKVEEEDEVSLNLDYGVIQKFGRVNITAPIFKEDLPKCIKDLEELKLAFLEKGDEERERAKAKFLHQARRGREPTKKAEGEETKEAKEGEGEEIKASEEAPMKAPADKIKLVERLVQMKRQQM